MVIINETCCPQSLSKSPGAAIPANFALHEADPTTKSTSQRSRRSMLCLQAKIFSSSRHLLRWLRFAHPCGMLPAYPSAAPVDWRRFWQPACNRNFWRCHVCASADARLSPDFSIAWAKMFDESECHALHSRAQFRADVTRTLAFDAACDDG